MSACDVIALAAALTIGAGAIRRPLEAIGALLVTALFGVGIALLSTALWWLDIGAPHGRLALAVLGAVRLAWPKRSEGAAMGALVGQVRAM